MSEVADREEVDTRRVQWCPLVANILGRDIYVTTDHRQDFMISIKTLKAQKRKLTALTVVRWPVYPYPSFDTSQQHCHYGITWMLFVKFSVQIHRRF